MTPPLTPTVLLDACVLYPAPLRDLLLRLSVAGLFHPRWTNQIHDEWIRNVLANRPDLSSQKLQRTRQLMDAHALDALVVGPEPLVPTLSLPDPDDRHVLAAAIHSRCSIILTFNLRDFPRDLLLPHGIEARHPDPFITSLLLSSPAQVCSAISAQRASLRNPPRTADELLGTLEAAGLTETTRQLRPLSSQL